MIFRLRGTSSCFYQKCSGSNLIPPLNMYPHKKKIHRRYWSIRFVVYFDGVIDGWVGMWSFRFFSVCVGTVFVWIGNKEKKVFFYVTRNRRNVQDFASQMIFRLTGTSGCFHQKCSGFKSHTSTLHVSTKKIYRKYCSIRFVVYFDGIIDGWVGKRMWSFRFCYVWVGTLLVWMGNRGIFFFFFKI